MKNKRGMRRLMSLLIVLAMVVTTMIPAGTTVFAAEKNSQGRAGILCTPDSNTIGSAGDGNYVTGLAENASGDMVVLGVTKSKIGTSDPSDSSQRVLVQKYSKKDLKNPKATDVIAGGKAEDIKQGDYVFGKKESVYTAGDQTYNGAVAMDESGNIYVAVTEKSTMSALYSDYEELVSEFSGNGCLCDAYSSECMYYGECTDENWEPVDCPVCNAFAEFNESFTGSSVKGITLYKFDKDLKQIGKFSIGSFPSEQTGTVDDPMAHGLAVDSAGNIYVGGSTNTDLGFKNPVKSFDDEDFAGNSGGRNGFIVKVNNEMTGITASTYIGGGKSASGYSSVDSAVNNLAVDGSDLYVIGKDQGGTIETTEGVLQPTFTSAAEAFIAKLSLNDLKITAATYYGGNGNEEVSGLKVDGDMIYVGGDSTSTNLTVSENAAYPTKGGSGSYPDGFVLKLNKSLKKTEDFAATYLNGTGREDLFGLDTDKAGNVYVTGVTTSASGMETTDGSDTGKIFIGKFNQDLSAMPSLSLVGTGETYDQGRGIIADEEAVYLAGQYGGSRNMQMFIAEYTNNFAHASIKKVEAKQKGYASSPKYYGTGASIDINIEFDAQVKVEGTPLLALNIKNAKGEQNAQYKSGSGTKVLTFSYTVQQGDSTNGQKLEVKDANGIDLNGGSILPMAGGTAKDIDLQVPVEKNNLGSSYIYVNTTPAKVTAVTSGAKDDSYGPGAVIPLTVTFDDVIKSVKGTPELSLNSGGKAVYKGISTTNKKELEFEYTVGSKDQSADLDYSSKDALTLPSGAEIKDNYGSDVDLTLPVPGEKGSLSEAKALVISPDTVVVQSVKVADSYKGKSYRQGSVIPIDITFSAPITTTGKMKLALNASKDYGSAVAVSEKIEEPTKTVILQYTVDKAHEVKGLDYTSVSALTMDGDGSVSSGENAVSLYLPKPASEQSLTPFGIVIDNTAPSNAYAPSVTKKNSSGQTDGKTKLYKAGDKMSLVISINEPVVVTKDAAPYIVMNHKTAEADKENARWTFEKAENTATASKLYFTYEVKEQDSLKNGTLNITSDWKIHMESGDITDAAGNELNPTLKALSSWGNPLAGIYFDSEGPVWEKDAELKVDYIENSKNLKITRPNATDDNSGLESTPYMLYRQVKGSQDEPEKVTTLSSSKTTYDDTSVAENTTYIYTITAVDKCGNVTSLKSKSIKTGNQNGEVDDTDAPYWDDDAALTVKRTTESTAVATWDKSKAHDDLNSLKEFRLYVKESSGNWKLLQTLGADKESVGLTGLTLEQYTFKVEVVDAGNNSLESTDGPTAVLAEEMPMFIVQDQQGKVIKQFLDTEFDDVELTKSRFSSLNNEGYRYYYAAQGIDVSEIIKMAGITQYSSANVASLDMASGRTFTKAQIEEGEGLYYYPANYDGKTVKESVVKPMIVFYYGESQSADPSFVEAGEGVPRLFYGQRTIDDVNKSYFAKNIYYITINTTDESVSFGESDSYEADTAAVLPTVKAKADGTAQVTAFIDGSKISSEKLHTVFVQMRGDKMIAIASAEKKNTGNLKVSSSFELKKDDKVTVFVVDSLNNTVGAPSQIINETILDADTDVSVKDIYLKNGSSVANIKGTAKPDSWVSVKITDKNKEIVYFNGVIADKNGEFSLKADVTDCARPLDVTVTCGKTAQTAAIYDFDELVVPEPSDKDVIQYTGGDAPTLDCGITGTGVTYQWYSNTEKSTASGTEISGAKGKTYTPSVKKAGITYYYAIAKDIEGNTVASNIFTVKVPVKAPKVTATSKGYNSIALSWTTSSGAEKYKVYRATAKSGTYKLIKTTTSTRYTNEKLSFNKTYYYKVVAVNDGGNGTSKIVSAKPLPAQTKITKLSKKSRTTRYVKWNKVSGADGYQVVYALDKNFKNGKHSRLVKKSTSKTIKNLKKNKKYYVKVRAYKNYKGKRVYGPYSTVKAK